MYFPSIKSKPELQSAFPKYAMSLTVLGDFLDVGAACLNEVVEIPRLRAVAVCPPI